MLLLTLIGVVPFYIEVTIIYTSLKIHIKEALHPLQGESFEVFQEETNIFTIFSLMGLEI